MRMGSRLRLTWGLYGLVFGISFASIAFVLYMRQAIILEQTSPYDFATTVQTIRANAVNRGWTVSGVDVLHGALAQTGAPDIPAVEMIELCHPDHACRILRSGKRSCMAMMPCSVTVYEKNGKVYIASLNRGLIGRFFRHEAFGILKQVRNEEREILHLAASH